MRRRSGGADMDAARFRLRARIVVAVLVVVAGVLGARAVQLQVLDQQFLAKQGDMRYTRVAKIPAHRGAMVDRFGEPIAVSSPVDTVYVNPRELAQAPDEIPRLAKALKRDPQWLAQRVTSNLDRQFLYVARHMDPADAARVRALGVPGVYLTREYKRYYPSGEVTGHVLGFTNLDDVGQEGMELAYDRSLAGIDGRKRVIQDGRGRIIENVESISAPRPGEVLELSLDLRIQYLAYRELKAAVRRHRARSGSVIVLDVHTGEVLAMVNQPSFNPNDRAQYEVARYRNRAVTDIIEPGSSIKPFVLAAALDSGRYRPDTVIDTNPGMIRVGVKSIQDKNNLGSASLTTILARSSNVGMAKIALSLERDQLHGVLRDLGFGAVTASGFPGESAGLLSGPAHWRPIGVATLSYGYGMSVTPLQLAHAYATIGSLGLRRPVTFRKATGPVPAERVLDEKVARDVIGLLEAVVTQGTGGKAGVPGYSVAGKTGTAWKAVGGSYSTDKYLAVFAGVAPASRPRLATVVLIDEPSGALYYGGDVAAPVFSSVMSGALRLMGVAPDDLSLVSPATTIVQVQP
ncbi:MAG: penicillin-binding transpeptidase domain-containing protein [Steroidobacteraceae bacterium]|nr:penicillin-binding transpeptidase domain-containing protein [Steroidobacteraceae bacterium]